MDKKNHCSCSYCECTHDSSCTCECCTRKLHERDCKHGKDQENKL